jgi:GNAT superfamily N-acetyltransferase
VDRVIVDATAADVDSVAALAAARRADYEVAQPRFWRVAGDALEQHRSYLAAQVEDPSVVSLVARSERRLDGFLFATIVQSPPVYDPGGPTGFVDDFAVASPDLWDGVGRALLSEARQRLAARGASQVVVVCGHHDAPKLTVLLASGLSPASDWLVAPVTP